MMDTLITYVSVLSFCFCYMTLYILLFSVMSIALLSR